jgi:hypothetical protein
VADDGAYVAAPDGSGLRRMVRSADPGTWDPTHTRLPYQVEFAPGTNAMCVVENGIGRYVATLRPPNGFAAPRAMQVWAVGNRPAAVDVGQDFVIKLYDAGGTGRVRHVVTMYPYDASPDGRIVCSTYHGAEPAGRVYVAGPDGSNPVQVADGPVSWISWSPKGDRLLLSSGHRNDAWLEVLDADGAIDTPSSAPPPARARSGSPSR